MDTNIVKDIANIYVEQIIESSHLETDMKKTDAYKSMAATAAKKFDEEFVDPEHGEAPSGRSPLQNVSDHPKASVRKKAVKAFRTQMGEEYDGNWKSRSNDPVREALDPVGKGYEEGEVSGKFKKKKKIKEGFSNWREDLSEVISDIKDTDRKVKERSDINNKIDINPKLDLGEAVEELGGTLLEMTEIEDFEGVFDELSESDIFFLNDALIEEVVEEVFLECLQEGYDVFEIENILLESLEISSQILSEQTDADDIIREDRLEKVKTAVKNVGKKITRGVGYVAGAAVRGAKAVRRELGSGYERGRYGSVGRPSGSSDSGSTSTQRSSSSSETTSSSGSGSSRPGLLRRIGSALKRGLKRVIFGKQEDEKPSSVHSKAGTRSPKLRRGIGGGKRIEVAGEPKKQEPVKKVSVTDVTPKRSKAPVGTPENPRVGQPGPKKKPTAKPQATTKTTKVNKPTTTTRRFGSSRSYTLSGEAAYQAAKAEMNKSSTSAPSQTPSTPPKPSKKTNSQTNKPQPSTTRSSRRSRKNPSVNNPAQKASKTSPEPNDGTNGKLDKLLKSIHKENYQLSEMSVSKDQQKLFGLALSVKRGETSRSEVSDAVLKIVDGMSEKEIRKFAKTSHEGLPKKVETKEEAIKDALIDKMTKKIAEQVMNTTQQLTTQKDPKAVAAAVAADERAKANAIQLKSKELATLRATPPGTSVPSFGG